MQLHFWSLFINCCFNHKLFHWACMKNFVFIHWRSLYKAAWTLNSYFCPVRTGASDRRKPAKCLSPRRGANKIIDVFFLCFLLWPYNKHLINRARSVSMGESWPRSPVQTWVKILPYWPPARLRRANYSPVKCKYSYQSNPWLNSVLGIDRYVPGGKVSEGGWGVTFSKRLDFGGSILEMYRMWRGSKY